MDTLGKRIARYRKAAGLSQASLAIACGWKSQSRVGNYESGTREPTLADLEKIASAVGVSVAHLTYGEGDPHQPATPPEPAGQGQGEAPAESPGHSLNMSALLKLKGKATPRSLAAIQRIEQAARQGRLKEEDVLLLEGIAARFEELNTKQP